MRGYGRGADFLGRRTTATACGVMLVAACSPDSPRRPPPPPRPAAISGIVTAAASGAPLAKVCVSVHRIDIDSMQLRSVATAANGRYTVTGLPPGTVDVQFADNGLCVGGAAGNYVGEYFNNEPSLRTATHIDINAGETKANINAALAVGGSIAGHVTGAGRRRAAHRVCVAAYLPGHVPLLVASHVDGEERNVPAVRRPGSRRARRLLHVGHLSRRHSLQLHRAVVQRQADVRHRRSGER